MQSNLIIIFIIPILGFIVQSLCMYVMLKPYKVSLKRAFIGTFLMVALFTALTLLIKFLLVEGYINNLSISELFYTLTQYAFLNGLIFLLLHTLLEILIEIWPALLYFKEVPKRAVLSAVSIAVFLKILALLGLVSIFNYLKIITA